MDKKIKKKISSVSREIFLTDDIFRQNEIHANNRVAAAMFNSGVVLFICWILVFAGVFNHVSLSAMTSVTVIAEIELMVGVIVCRITKGEKVWVKALLLFLMVTSFARIDSVLAIYVPILMALPVIISCRYHSRWVTRFVAIVSTIFFALSAFSSAYLDMGLLDLNAVVPTGDGTILAGGSLRDAVLLAGYDNMELAKDVMLHVFLPKFMIFVLICIVCAEVAVRGRKMILDANEVADKNARIQTELNMASKLQSGLLPHLFPIFPEREEFLIYASMDAAKEVGGDFYDMFFVDRDHLAIVMADVSGKGVPAALFMMASKSIINNRATIGGGTPGEILTFVNEKLCENNEAEMFVTVWLGILEISSGILTVSNAGHENPAIRKAGGEYVLQKDKHDFVIGGLEGIKYKNYTHQLEPGDSLFIYTDGVTEATNGNKELYGEGRMIEALNKNPGAEPNDILKIVREDIDNFVGKEEQFDDITMLCIRYNGA